MLVAFVLALPALFSIVPGRDGSRAATCLSAFLLLCIGVQVLVTGVADALGPPLRAR